MSLPHVTLRKLETFTATPAECLSAPTQSFFVSRQGLANRSAQDPRSKAFLRSSPVQPQTPQIYTLPTYTAMPAPRHHDLAIHDSIAGYQDSRYPRLQPPPSYSLPHPDQPVRQQQQKQLASYHERNHGKFHERNRGSKKAGFLGMLKLVLKCGCFANDVADAVA